MEYLAQPGYLASFIGQNFVPGDGVSTVHVINYQGDIEPDYLVVTDESSNILHRWFVMEHDRLRSGQYKLTLLRDLLVDFYSDVINAKCFIEKATLGINNPLIFNSENMTYNQIKTSETLLKDKTESAWIVGYVDKGLKENKQINLSANNIVPDEVVSSIDNYTFSKYVNGEFIGAPSRKAFRINTYVPTPSYTSHYNYYFDSNGNKTSKITGADEMIQNGVGYVANDTRNGYLFSGYNVNDDAILTKVANKVQDYARIESWVMDYEPITGEHTQAQTNLFLAENGKILQVGDVLYQIQLRPYKIQKEIAIPAGITLYTRMEQVITNIDEINENISYEPVFDIQIEALAYQLKLMPVYNENYQLIISAARDHLEDAPYDMFAIPYSDDLSIRSGATKLFNCNKATSLKLAQQIQIELGQSLYDLQLLPYCPLTAGCQKSKGIDISFFPQAQASAHYAFLNNTTTTDEQKGILFWCNRSSFQVQIPNINIKVPNNNVAFKIANECDMYRIVSPNYASSFEISATKNGGLNNFAADCSYKPYTPYIRVAPQFNRLYGQDFGDARGLILGGDFSLPNVQSAWVNYQLNNKNYQLAFDRQIDNLEFNQDLERKLAIAGAFAGGTTGVAAGASGGYMFGGPIGAAIGASAGLVSSTIGGVADYRFLKQRQTETIDYTKDQFGYQLGNIQAQPRTLNKVSSFNKNNKIWPFIEYYTATETEKQALKDKIEYNGMTVMTIGTVAQYQLPFKTYIKGKLIRLNINGDDKIISAIADELNRGVFI